MMAGVRSVVLCCSCDILLTIVMAGVRSARLEQKREKYLRRRQQLSHAETGVSRKGGDILTIRPFDRLDVF